MRRRPTVSMKGSACWFYRRKPLLAIWFCVFSLSMACSEGEHLASEYVVKAAFLFHFASYADWPDGSLGGEADPLTFCTVGEDPFRGALDTSVAGKSLGKRPFRVRHFKEPDEVRDCQILFVGAQEEKRATGLMEKLTNSPVLTAGETERFVEQGGIIAFRSEDGKLGFDINLVAAERAKIKISARLLALAKHVIGKPK